MRAYYHTYSLPVVISNCSNNYGPAQHFEKLIPLMIKNIVDKKSLPVYGDGKNIRDWLYVEDHVEAIDLILHRGKIGETYLIGGENEKRNIDLVLKLIKMTSKAGKNANIPVSICGEMAGDVFFTALLIGMGINILSMSTSRILKVKQFINFISLKECFNLSQKITEQTNSEDIKKHLECFKKKIENRI